MKFNGEANFSVVRVSPSAIACIKPSGVLPSCAILVSMVPFLYPFLYLTSSFKTACSKDGFLCLV